MPKSRSELGASDAAATAPPAATTTRRRSTFRRVAAAGCGVLAALALAEGALRVTGAREYAPRVASYHFIESPRAGYWRFDPSHPPEHVWDGDPYGRLPPGARMTYEIGSGGLRGEPPPAGPRPVVVLGDSFTFGEGVRLADTFVARLGRAFASQPDAPAFVNAGVPGYGTAEEAARLPSLLDIYFPRAILLVAVPNDVIPQVDQVDAADLIATDRGPHRGLRLVALAAQVFSRPAADRAVEEWYLSYYVGERRQAWDAARRSLLGIAERCRARGVRLGVVMFPILHRLGDAALAPAGDAFEGACRDAGVPFLDLTPALAVESDRALWIHPTDHHPDARAHELAAEAMRPFVARLLE